MARNYVKKRTPKYTADDVKKAVAAVTSKQMTYRQAQETFGVPKSVICSRISWRVTTKETIGAGRPTALSPEIEQGIARCVEARAEMGYPVDKEELLDLVQEFVIENNLETPFKDSRPGQEWYANFIKRTQILSLKKPELLQKCRKTNRKPDIVYSFFDMLEGALLKHNLIGEDKSCFIFNADESGFNSDPSKIKAIGIKGKPLFRVTGGSGRSCTTVLACVSADGVALPPLIVFKGAAVQARWVTENAVEGTLYAASTNGWMEEAQFYYWFKDCFLVHVNKIRETTGMPEQTAVLLYDGHKSHISVRIVQEAIENKICLVKLPSHLTDKLQPLDKTVFGPFKAQWDKQLVDYGKSKMGINSSVLPKEMFSQLLSKVWKESMRAENIIAGFRSTGIYPVNRSKFPEHLFDPLELKEYRERLGLQQSSSQSSNSSTPIPNLPQFSLQTSGQATPLPQAPTLNVATDSIQSHNNCLQDMDVLVQTPPSKNCLPCRLGLQTSQSTNHSPQSFDQQPSGPPSSDSNHPTPENQQETSFLQLGTQQACCSSWSSQTPENKDDELYERKCAAKQIISEQTKTVMEFFSSKMIEYKRKYTPASIVPLDEEEDENKRNRVARLKQLTYGEVLTGEKVLQRLKEAEVQKMKKNKAGPKKLQKNQQTMKVSKKRTITASQSNETDVGLSGEMNKGSDSQAEKRKKKITPAKEETSDTSDSEVVVPLAETDDEDLDLDGMRTRLEVESVEPVECESPIFEENVKKGRCVLVAVKGGLRKATHYKYVCSIISVDSDDGEIVVQGLRTCNSKKTEFVETENDIFTITVFDIIAVLPTPKTTYKNRQITYEFPGYVSVYEQM